MVHLAILMVIFIQSLPSSSSVQNFDNPSKVNPLSIQVKSFLFIPKARLENGIRIVNIKINEFMTRMVLNSTVLARPKMRKQVYRSKAVMTASMTPILYVDALSNFYGCVCLFVLHLI